MFPPKGKGFPMDSFCSEMLVRSGKYSLQITRCQQMTVIGKENFCKLQIPFLLLCMAIYYYTIICSSVRYHYLVIVEKTNNICNYLVASSASGIKRSEAWWVIVRHWWCCLVQKLIFWSGKNFSLGMLSSMWWWGNICFEIRRRRIS